jgi:polysaccharide biosynthesis/export protein
MGCNLGKYPIYLNTRFNIFCFLFTTVVFISYGCGGGTSSKTVVSESIIKAQQETSELNSKLMMQGSASSKAASSPADYLIGPADLLEVKVYESDKLSDTVRVSSRGSITLPLIGNVYVSDLSAREAEQLIETELQNKGYIVDPNVTVFIKEYNSKQVSVVGYVGSPGTYSLEGRETLLDVLVEAKGFSDQAGRTIYVNRTESSGNGQTYMVDLEELLLKGNSNLNIDLKPGDVIYVPSSGNVYIAGAVRKTGSYPLKGEFTTLSQIITTAGGTSSYANNSDVKIIRYLGDGEREIMQVDLGKILNGEGEDILVKDRDAIIVGASGTKRLLYGLNIGLGFGLFNLGYTPPEK